MMSYATTIWKHHQVVAACIPRISLPILSLRYSSTNVNPVGNDLEMANAKPMDQIPGPKGLPIIGTLLDYVRNDGWGFKNLFAITEERRQQYGPIYEEKMGHYSIVYVSTVEDAEKVLRAEGKYPDRNPIIPLVEYRKKRNLSMGVILSKDEEWKKFRSVMDKKMMRPREIAYYSDRINDLSNDFIQRLKRLRGNNGIVLDIEKEINKYTAESVAGILLEKRLGMFKEPIEPKVEEFYQSVTKILEATSDLLTVPVFVFKYIFNKNWKKLVKWSDLAFQFADDIIEEKREQLEKKIASTDDIARSGSGVDFLSYVIATGKLNRSEANVVMIELLLTGIDTGANTLLWMLYDIGKNPRVQNRLRDEIRGVMKDSKEPNLDLFQKMPYLRACLQETLRIHPISVALPRIINEDLVLSGYKVPAKSFVWIGHYFMARDESAFTNPSQYMPERWLRGSDRQGNKSESRFQYLPFGYGPRMCIGKRIAEMEIYTLMSKLILECEIETKNSSENTPINRMILVPRDKMQIAFHNLV
ncbi:Cytochrome P450 10 [Trichoplax sp. H2]|nr:Cytochrome P450 10 [Trichoplax sp. H2]|eukprot:RDD38261.1 Cytochrome P450 10 [Trichoplax sp. H2]